MNSYQEQITKKLKENFGDAIKVVYNNPGEYTMDYSDGFFKFKLKSMSFGQELKFQFSSWKRYDIVFKTYKTKTPKKFNSVVDKAIEKLKAERILRAKIKSQTKMENKVAEIKSIGLVGIVQNIFKNATDRILHQAKFVGLSNEDCSFDIWATKNKYRLTLDINLDKEQLERILIDVRDVAFSGNK